MIDANRPALVLAPMDGITDAPMRAMMGQSGAFSYAVSEFVRVSVSPIPRRVFLKEIPELTTNGRTVTGMPVQVQILGGDPERMAKSAVAAVQSGAWGIDINFGCPAPTVNRNDGGASLLRSPARIRELVRAVRAAVPPEIPVSAKLRLGWDSIDAIFENALMAAEGGSSWLTIHARTKVQGYQPPVYWSPFERIRSELGLPVIANGDIFTLDDFHRAQDETGCIHFMMGRGALSNPTLPTLIARELGISNIETISRDWSTLLRQLVDYTEDQEGFDVRRTLPRLKQWLKIAANFGDFRAFDSVKHATSLSELFMVIDRLEITPFPQNSSGPSGVDPIAVQSC